MPAAKRLLKVDTGPDCIRCNSETEGTRFMHSETYKAHERWMRAAGLSENTIRTRRAALRSLIGQQHGRPLADLTEENLEEWAQWIAARLSRSSRHVYVSNVRSYYAWAYEQGRHPSDPARRLPVPSLPRRVPHPIDGQSLAYAIAILGPHSRIRCWLALAAMAGLRACEIAGLRGENVILTGGEPYLHIVADATKGITERIVPVSAELAAILTAARLPDRGPCFRKLHDPDECVSANLVSKVCNEHLRECGVTGFTLHAGRHRFLTEAQRATGNILTTQKLAGHASPATTAGYALVTDTDTRAAVDAIPPLDAA